MFDVICDGIRIARAESQQEKEIYILHFRGVNNQEIADSLGILLKSVTRLTEGGATR